MSSTVTSVVWIESTSWELDFFGLPHRIPWPGNVDSKLANGEPFPMDHLLDAIEALGAEAEEPWSTFLKASENLDEFGEAVQNSEIVRAYELLENFDAQFPETAFALYHRGSLARLEGDDEGAVELLTAAGEKAPRGVAIWNSLGVVQAMLGQREEAVAAFRKALAIAPQDRTALEGLTQLREVVKLLRKADDPNSAIYMDLPTFGQMAERQIQQMGNDHAQLLNYGEQLLKEGFAPEAGLEALKRAHALQPEDPRSVFTLTAAYRVQDKLEEARATITQYTEKHPEDPRGFFNLGQVCNALRDAEGEMRSLDRVLEIDPNAQAPLGLRFGLGNAEHDPAKEQELAKFGEERKSWMAYVIASNIARQRGDAKRAVKWAEAAYALAPETEEVLLHYTAALGEARDFEKLVSVIKPQVDSGKFSKRINWNYAQVLQQVGLTDDAVRVLREAAVAGDVPPDFKTAVATTIEAWTGELTGCGVQLEVHQSGFLQRPILLTIDGEEGGIVMGAGAKLPAANSFPWRAASAEARVALQQGEDGGSLEPSPLGTFIVRGVEPGTTIDCHLAAMPDGALHFRATQNGRKLKVGWAPLGIEKR
jgi:tetratricopeptide (TPR) repeat protein